jgi:hypothetical protein
METIPVRRNVPFHTASAAQLMDLYYPPRQAADARWPVVMIVAGYPGKYKELGWTVSMAQLIAMSGISAIAYSNREPV